MKELREKLRRLSIPQLKSLAEDFEVDVSNCRRRNEYIDAIVASGVVLMEDVDTFLSIAGPAEEAPVGDEGRAGDEGVPVAEQEPAEPAPKATAEESRPAPAEPESDSDIAIREHLTADIDLTTTDANIQTLKTVFEGGKHRDVHGHAKQMITAASEMLKKVERTGYAYVLTSATHIVNEMKVAGLDVTQVEKMLSKGKAEFAKNLDSTRKIVADLEVEIERLKTEQVSKLEGKLKEIDDSITQAKKIDAEVDEAEELMKEARALYEAQDFSECVKLIQEVDDIIQDAHRAKIQGITQLVLDVDGLIENAKSIGADTSDAEKILTNAKNAFKTKDYVTCIEDLNKAEEMVSSRLQTKLEEIEKMKERQKARIENKLLTLIDESSQIPNPDVAARIEEKFENIKVALDANDISRATMLLRDVEREVKGAKVPGAKPHAPVVREPEPPAPAPRPQERPAPRPAPVERQPEPQQAPSRPQQPPAPQQQPQAELLPLQRPCKWCGYRGVEYYSTGVAKCPGCNRTYQWR